MKDNLELKGNWNKGKGKLKQEIAQITDDDSLLIEGKKDELLGRLQLKIKKSKDNIKKIFTEL